MDSLSIPHHQILISTNLQALQVMNEGMGGSHFFCVAGLTLHFTLTFEDPAFIDFELGRNQGSIDFSG